MGTTTVHGTQTVDGLWVRKTAIVAIPDNATSYKVNTRLYGVSESDDLARSYHAKVILNGATVIDRDSTFMDYNFGSYEIIFNEIFNQNIAGTTVSFQAEIKNYLSKNHVFDLFVEINTPD